MMHREHLFLDSELLAEGAGDEVASRPRVDESCQGERNIWWTGELETHSG